MRYTITCNQETRIIEAVIQGDVFWDNLKTMTIELARISKASDSLLILNDFREASLKLSTMEIYSIPQMVVAAFADSGIDNVYRFRRAIVVAKDVHDYRFWECMVNNNAQTEKIFYDTDEAQKWLLQQ